MERVARPRAAGMLGLLLAAAAQPAAAASASYSGSASCRPCHAEQFRAWTGSAHAVAMRPVSASGRPGATKLPQGKIGFGAGNSSRAEFLVGAETVVVAEPGSPAARAALPWVLGASTLEQPLVGMDHGRLQALPVAYDPARREWFDIFQGEERLPGEFGHWRGRGMNANSQCIECHATGYRKNHDVESATYSSAWAEAGVGCESCHGPGGDHLHDTKRPYGPFPRLGAIAAFRPKPAPVPAQLPAAVGTPAMDTPPLPKASPPAAAAPMLDLCATCHSVRREIATDFLPGDALLDHYEPDLLDNPTYWPSGLVRGESYEWGSFVQSRMHAAGVNCLACHDVHSGKLRAEGNDLCLSCHDASLAAAKHTAHRAGSTGSQCVACHMPESVFMARDHRRDHSLAIPDPLAAQQTASPSACESCHADRSRETLAADAQRLWPVLAEGRYARRRAVTVAFAQAREGKAEAAGTLRRCLSGEVCDTAILRASAARLTALLALDDATAGALLDGLEDDDALVRSASAFALADADPREPMLRQWLSRAVRDPVRAVRLNAAWALRTIETKRLPADQMAELDRAFGEWRNAILQGSDAAENWHSLGVFETARDDPKAAEAAYRRAIALEPAAVPTRQNLAMLLVLEGRTAEARKEFENLVAVDDGFAPAWFALGMIEADAKNWPEAARHLSKCLKIAPDYPGALVELTHAYLEAGLVNLARAVLSAALEHPSVRRDALTGLVALSLKVGDRDGAATAAKMLVKEFPDAAGDPTVRDLSSVAVTDPPLAAALPFPPQVPGPNSHGE